MADYKNPVPSTDDEQQSKTVYMPFTFPEPVTAKEAADSINRWFSENRLSPENVILTGEIGIRFHERQARLGPNDSDPSGNGPR